MKQLNKKEIGEWIKFLYNDLLMDNVLIYGYYFNLQQEKELEQTAHILNTQIRRYLDEINKLSKDVQKSQTKDVQRRINKLYNQMDNVHVPLNVKNKFGEPLILPCTVDEFNIVLKEFNNKLDIVDHFLKDSEEDLQDIEETNLEELNCFMWYLNDVVEDIRQQFAGITKPPVQ